VLPGSLQALTGASARRHIAGEDAGHVRAVFVGRRTVALDRLAPALRVRLVGHAQQVGEPGPADRQSPLQGHDQELLEVLVDAQALGEVLVLDLVALEPADVGELADGGEVVRLDDPGVVLRGLPGALERLRSNSPTGFSWVARFRRRKAGCVASIPLSTTAQRMPLASTWKRPRAASAFTVGTER
jgi:hypothetical protein